MTCITCASQSRMRAEKVAKTSPLSNESVSPCARKDDERGREKKRRERERGKKLMSERCQ